MSPFGNELPDSLRAPGNNTRAKTLGSMDKVEKSSGPPVPGQSSSTRRPTSPRFPDSRTTSPRSDALPHRAALPLGAQRQRRRSRRAWLASSVRDRVLSS